jgi:hypothetical protein
MSATLEPANKRHVVGVLEVTADPADRAGARSIVIGDPRGAIVSQFEQPKA